VRGRFSRAFILFFSLGRRTTFPPPPPPPLSPPSEKGNQKALFHLAFFFSFLFFCVECRGIGPVRTGAFFPAGDFFPSISLFFFWGGGGFFLSQKLPHGPHKGFPVCCLVFFFSPARSWFSTEGADESECEELRADGPFPLARLPSPHLCSPMAKIRGLRVALFPELPPTLGTRRDVFFFFSLLLFFFPLSNFDQEQLVLTVLFSLREKTALLLARMRSSFFSVSRLPFPLRNQTRSMVFLNLDLHFVSRRHRGSFFFLFPASFLVLLPLPFPPKDLFFFPTVGGRARDRSLSYNELSSPAPLYVLFHLFFSFPPHARAPLFFFFLGESGDPQRPFPGRSPWACSFLPHMLDNLFFSAGSRGASFFP